MARRIPGARIAGGKGEPMKSDEMPSDADAIAREKWWRRQLDPETRNMPADLAELWVRRPARFR